MPAQDNTARLYWENKADFFDAKPITIPFAISVFPDELYQAPRSWAEAATSPPGNGRTCSPPKCGTHSGHCASRAEAADTSAPWRWCW